MPVYVGAGSNVEPLDNLRLARRELAERFGELEVSRVYRNPAVGFDGEDFLNLVFGFETALEPLTLLGELEAIHDLAGRERSAAKYGPRPLDLDLLLYGSLVIDEPPLQLPREDILSYGFVLRPLAEMAPELPLPGDGRALGALWREYGDLGHPLRPEDVVI